MTMSHFSTVSTPLCGRKGCISVNLNQGGTDQCDFLKGYQLGKRSIAHVDIRWRDAGTLSFKLEDNEGKSKVYIMPAEQGIPYIKTMFHAWIKAAQVYGQFSEDVTQICFSGELLTLPLAEGAIQFFEGPPKERLQFNVTSILNKDLLHPDTAPAWYRDIPWFVVDDISKRFEEEQGTPYLYTGKVPLKDQKLEICAYLPNKTWGRLSGVVTNVLAPPSYEQASRLCSPQHRFDENSCLEARHVWGAVHGQQVEGTISLNFDFQYKRDLVDFFRGGDDVLYNVVLWCHHCKVNVWEVMRIESFTPEKQITNVNT